MPRRDDSRGEAPALLLAAAATASVVVLLVLGSGLTFYQDSWAFLLERQGFTAHAFLAPHNEHIVVIPVAIQKLLVALFGLHSDMPERALLAVVLAATGLLVFIYVRRRVGAWLALIAATVLLFLGPAWEVLLWPFEISLAGSALTGVAMLLALDRNDRRGDVAACFLLVASIGFSSLGLPFAAAALVHVLLHRHRRGLGRLYVAVVPLFLYGLWYVTYGHEATSTLSRHGVLTSPITVVEGFSVATSALLGLIAAADQIGGRARVWMGLIALLCGIAAFLYHERSRFAAVRRLRSLPVPLSVWPVAAAALAFWLLAGFNERGAEASRYIHIGAIFVILIAADLLSGVRVRNSAMVVVIAVAIAVVASNIDSLLEGSDFLHEQSELTRADLASVEIARRTVAPDFWLHPDLAGTWAVLNVHAGPYLSLVRDDGSPAYTVSELEAAPEEARRRADIVLAAALPVTAHTKAGFERRSRRGCAALPPSGRLRAAGLALRPGIFRIAVGSGGAAALRMRRFAAAGFPVRLATVPGDSTTSLTIPADWASRRWRLQVRGARRVVVCGPALSAATGAAAGGPS